MHLFQTYTPEYEEELYERIAVESKNKVRLERNLIKDRKKRDVAEKATLKKKESRSKDEEKKEARRQLECEMRHQSEEAETRALGRAMIADAQNNRPSFNRSCQNLLLNYQGTLEYCIYL